MNERNLLYMLIKVLIEGPSRIVYSPDKPLSCGAKVWLETYDNVIVLEESSK